MSESPRGRISSSWQHVVAAALHAAGSAAPAGLLGSTGRRRAAGRGGEAALFHVPVLTAFFFFPFDIASSSKSSSVSLLRMLNIMLVTSGTVISKACFCKEIDLQK